MEMEWTSFVGSQVSKCCFAFGVFFILFIKGNSQDVVVSIPRQNGVDHQSFYTSTEDTFLVVFYHNRFDEITELDIVSIGSKNYLHWVIPSGGNWIDLRVMDKDICLYYSKMDEDNQRLTIQEVRIEDMHLGKTSEVLSYPLSKSHGNPRFSLRSNSHYLVFLSRNMTSKRKDLLAFQCSWVDGRWQLKNGAEWQIAKHWMDWELSRWEIDERGDIVLIPGENRNFDIQENRVLPVKWELYYYQFEAKHLKEWDLLIGDKQIREAYWVHLSDSTLVLGVLCSSLNQEETKGWLQYTINTKRADVVSQMYQPFLYPQGSERKWQGVGLVKGGDGKYALVGEHYYSTEVRTTDFQTGRTYSNWVQHFDEMYFQLLKPDLSLQDSVSQVFKSQEVQDGEGCSFRVFERSGHWFVEYNDADVNDPWQESKRSWTGRKGLVKQVDLTNKRTTSGQNLIKDDAFLKKAVWVPVEIKEGSLSIWWTINEILICRDKK